MNKQKFSDLYYKKQSIEFYEDRYHQGYMEEHLVEQKRKILEVIKEIGLPGKGEGLDFGCGNGVLTEVIRQALPSWKIYGTDISNKAINNAKIRFPECTFIELSDPSFDYNQKKFDFVFTHHVFEHVYNLNEVFNQMNKFLKPKSSMVHFLPCGNEGSYEYNVCLLRKDGINKELENRFFFEEEGHVRRLKSEDFVKLCQTKGFDLQKEYYAYQYYGAIEWITNISYSNPKFIIMFSDSINAINKKAKRKLNKIRIHLIILAVFRLPAQIVTKLLKKRNKQLKHYIILLVGLPFFVFSIPIDKYWKRKARNEWDNKKYERNGSEMCLYFIRN